MTIEEEFAQMNDNDLMTAVESADRIVDNLREEEYRLEQRLHGIRGEIQERQDQTVIMIGILQDRGYFG